jgi:hypothetical protein
MPLTDEQREAIRLALVEPRQYYYPLLQRPDFEDIRRSNALTDTTRETLFTDPTLIQAWPFPFQAFGDLGTLPMRMARGSEWEKIHEMITEQGIFSLKPPTLVALDIDDPGVPTTQAVLRDNLPMYKDFISYNESVELYNYYVAAVSHANMVFRHMILGELPVNYRELRFDRTSALGLVKACAIDDNAIGLSVLLNSKEASIPVRESGLANFIPIYNDPEVMESIITCDAARCAKFVLDQILAMYGSDAERVKEVTLGEPDEDDEEDTESDDEGSESDSDSDRVDEEEEEVSDYDDEDTMGLKIDKRSHRRTHEKKEVGSAKSRHMEAREAVDVWWEAARELRSNRILGMIRACYRGPEYRADE